MTNNALKRKHIPKKSRHWKLIIVVHISDKELEYAFEDVKATSELVNRLMNNVVDGYTEHMNNNRPEWWNL